MRVNGRVALLLLVVTGTLLAAAAPAAAQDAETAAVITEIKPRRGAIEVRRAGETAWAPAAPLLALRPGDAVRATEDATAVVLLSGGRGGVTVRAGAAPLVVPAGPPQRGRVDRALQLLRAAFGFLEDSGADPPRAVLATRGGPRPPIVLAPRNSLVLPGPIAIEWRGARFVRYTVRLTDPQGVVLERHDVTGDRLEYPGDAPALRPGTPYTVEVLARGYAPERAWFEVVDPARAQVLRADLERLVEVLGDTTTPSTAAAVRVGHLVRQGLLHDARLAVLDALARDPEEPVLHRLLGQVYARTGLADLAAEAFAEAQFRATPGPGH